MIEEEIQRKIDEEMKLKEQLHLNRKLSMEEQQELKEDSYTSKTVSTLLVPSSLQTADEVSQLEIHFKINSRNSIKCFHNFDDKEIPILLKSMTF